MSANFLAYVNTTKNGLRESQDMPHVDIETKNLMKDAVEIITKLQSERSSGGSADTSMYRKKLDLLKVEHKAAEKKLANLSENIVPTVASKLKNIFEVAKRLESGEEISDAENKEIAKTLKSCAQEIVNTFI